MRHNLKITVSKKKVNGGLLSVKLMTVREKLLRFLLGSPVKLTVLVPGDSVDEVAISEIAEGGGTNDDPKSVYVGACGAQREQPQAGKGFRGAP
jgi:hypothetical protein